MTLVESRLPVHKALGNAIAKLRACRVSGATLLRSRLKIIELNSQLIFRLPLTCMDSYEKTVVNDLATGKEVRIGSQYRKQLSLVSTVYFDFCFIHQKVQVFQGHSRVSWLIRWEVGPSAARASFQIVTFINFIACIEHVVHYAEINFLVCFDCVLSFKYDLV